VFVTGFLDSNSEDSDTDISDVGDIDSDLEQEKQVRYDREVYREDAAELRKLEKGVTHNYRSIHSCQKVVVGGTNRGI
jgi:D-alanine-D-alanine ligase-like ATP-grasp enzyme